MCGGGGGWCSAGSLLLLGFFSSCGEQGLLSRAQAQQLRYMDLVAPLHVGSSQIGART